MARGLRQFGYVPCHWPRAKFVLPEVLRGNIVLASVTFYGWRILKGFT